MFITEEIVYQAGKCMDSTKKQQILETYCSNNMQKLKQLCYPQLNRIGGISDMDYDDFYSIALDVLWDSTERYDETNHCKFTTFLYSNIQKKFNTEIRNRNRKKKIPRDKIEYLDADTDSGINLHETATSSLDIELQLEEECSCDSQCRVQEYLNCLSGRQKEIAELLKDGYAPGEIRSKLNITEKQYVGYLKDMRTFEKARILRYAGNAVIKEEKAMKEVQTQTLEKSKADRLCIAAITKRIENYTIRFDHPLQRESEQWSTAMKGNLISDILQGNPIPPLVFAEQIVNGLAIIWDLDGKQRCTNAYSFARNGFKISKNIRRWKIQYQVTLRDSMGKPVLDEKGFPQNERRECDIRGKKYSDLPEELQDKFNDYNFEIIQYLNCSGEDIAYHIARYNEGKPMTVSQRGITRIGEEYAAMVKNIADMSFFKDNGNYKMSEFRNGTISRVIVESVMAANFLKDWKKSQEDMCSYINENATAELFENFEEMVDRLAEVVDEDVSEMFNSKDSFIWFGLFARFMETGLDDKKFVEFLNAFSTALHGKVIDKVSFDDLNGKSTKDRSIVIQKMQHLEKLMKEFLRE